MVAGRSLLQRSVEALAPYVDEIVVVLPAGHRDRTDVDGGPARVVSVSGGITRQHSVRNALAALSGSVEWVLVHDAARALVPPQVVRRVLAALQSGALCVVPAIAPHDSLRLLTTEGRSEPLDRSQVRLVQTPQGFTVGALKRGHEMAEAETATDDATLVESTGEAVTLVAGDPRAFKITHPLDLALAEAILSRSA